MNVSNQRFVVGAGAQGRVVLEAWRAQHSHGAFAFLDDSSELVGSTIAKATVLGPLSQLAELEGEVVLAIGNNSRRLELAREWDVRSIRWGVVIHPSATIASSARVERGAVVLAGAVVNSDGLIGSHALVNTGAIVEHDCVLESAASVGPGACMGGRVVIGSGAFISTGVTIAPRIRIGAGAIVGAGAVVVQDIPPGVLAYGTPARVVRATSESDWKRLL